MYCRACSKELGELELSLHQDIHLIAASVPFVMKLSTWIESKSA